MEALVPQVSHHLNDTLSPDEALIRSATRALDELSMLTAFPFSLITIIRGDEFIPFVHLQPFTLCFSFRCSPSQPSLSICEGHASGSRFSLLLLLVV